MIDPTTKTLSITILCKTCNVKFPSPIFLATYGSFMSSSLIGNVTRCPNGHQVSCNTENFVARFEGGGFVGNDAL